jgi:hypothetical protein
MRADRPTLGYLAFMGKFICFTFELPWLMNKHNISCIPPGKYECMYLHDYKSSSGVLFKDTFHLLGVPGRDGILIHCGNTVDDIKGCLLMGQQLSFVNDRFSILYSREGLNALLKTVGNKDFIMEIACID